MSKRPKVRTSLACLAAIAALQSGATYAEDVPARASLALMGTIPIYWGEGDAMGDHINGGAHAHWARAELEHSFELVPIDFLSAERLEAQSLLLMAQPRGLAAEENMALDNWVRAGGKLLLFADPAMTGHSRFSVGDRRRPQDVALLSPILSHWGLELQVDDSQQPGLVLVDHFAVPMPVNLPGNLVPADGRFECTVSASGIIAHCVLGVGEVLIIADAAILDIDGPHPQATEALHVLTAHIFTDFGENAGNPAASQDHTSQTHGNPPDSSLQAMGDHQHGSP